MLKAQALGQLLLMQSILIGLPDERSIFSFVCRGLTDMPGVASVHYKPEQGDDPGSTGMRFPLVQGDINRGEILIELADADAFAPYVDYLNNFCFMLTVILAERAQRKQNREYQTRLEHMVEERTVLLRGQIAENKGIEERLRKSEKLLNEAQAIAKTGGWEYDVATGRITWSEGTYHIYEVPADYDPNDLSRVIQFYEPSDREIIRDAFSEAISRGRSYDLELCFTSARGTPKWVRTMGQAEIRNGNVVRVYGNIIDITERKQADLALLLASHKWRTTFDAMLDPVALLSLDGTVTQYNQAFAEFCGQDIKALKGRKCFEIVHHTKTHIEYCPLVRLRQSATRETMELVMDDRVLFVIADPVKSQSGELVGVVHIIRDITEQKKAKEALEQSNARYQMVAEIVHDFIIITDL
ncbi:MAG: PAS domain-containing protein, partial [Smithellaceae bacterium]